MAIIHLTLLSPVRAVASEPGSLRRDYVSQSACCSTTCRALLGVHQWMRFKGVYRRAHDGITHRDAIDHPMKFKLLTSHQIICCTRPPIAPPALSAKRFFSRWRVSLCNTNCQIANIIFAVNSAMENPHELDWWNRSDRERWEGRVAANKNSPGLCKVA